MSDLILFSGGLESSLCGVMLRGQPNVAGLHFARKGKESLSSVDCAFDILHLLNIGIYFHFLEYSQFLNEGAFVYNRNLRMLISASEIAVKYDFDRIVIGTNDTGGQYPDATQEAIEVFQDAIQRSMPDEKVPSIVNPLQSMNKWSVARSLKNLCDKTDLESIFELGTSCDMFEYESNNKVDIKNHTWGVGCGECQGCENRRTVCQEVT